MPNTDEARANSLVQQISKVSDVAADIFSVQWVACRGPWEREDWFDRAAATVKFYDSHTWSEEWQRWLPE